MATCKDCLHVEACSRKQKIVIDGLNRAAQYAEKITNEKIEVGCSKEESLCELFCDRSRFVELPCKVGDVLYGIVPWGNGYKIVSVYVEEIILALRRDKNRVAEKGVFDIKIRPKRRKPIDLKDIFFTVEQAEQALKERESGA